MISVVIPAYNAEATIGDQLAAMAGQGFEGDWEVIVADNASTDGTVAVVRSWMGQLPVRVLDASARRGAAAARNIGASAAVNEILAFTDADDVVQPGWLAAIAGLPTHVHFATGPVSRFREGGAVSPVEVGGSSFRHMGFLRYAGGTNTVVRRELFETSGRFREDYKAGEDVEFSWRLQLEGTELAYLPRALVAARFRSGARVVLRQYFDYGRGDVQLYEQYRSRGCQRPAVGPTVRSYAGLIARVPLLFNTAQRDRWTHQLGRRAGRVAGSVDRRILLL